MTDGPFGSNLKSSHYTSSGPRVIRLQNIGDGVFKYEDAHISQEHYEELEAHSVRAGDLVVASLGADLPRACLVPAEIPPAIVKADCIRVRLHSEINPRYINYALQRPDLRHMVEGQIHGVGRPRLGMAGIKALPIPVAPVDEQRRIVDAIEEHFSRVDQAEADLRACQVRTVALLNSTVALAFSGDWPRVRLSDIADVHLGRQRSPKNHQGPYMRPYLRAGNVTWNGLDLSDVKQMNFDPVEAERFALEPGDILLAEASGSASEVGRPVLWQGEITGACFQNTLLRVQAKGPLPEYLLHYFRHLATTGVFAKQSRGVGIHHLGKLAMERFEVPTPPLKEQARIVTLIEETLSRINAAMATLETSLAKSRVLRRTILAQAFTGLLVPQASHDEPASVLLQRIRAERDSLRNHQPSMMR